MKRIAFALTLAQVLVIPSASQAAVITFDSEFGTAFPNSITGVLNSPISAQSVTFTGGQLVNNETNSIDLTTVYATAQNSARSFPYSNPLLISFSPGIADIVSLVVTNNVAGTVTVSANTGASITMFLPINSFQTFTLTGPGITQLTVLQTDASFVGPWNFAIDNVSFSTVPEPETGTLVALSIAALVLKMRFDAVRGGSSKT